MFSVERKDIEFLINKEYRGAVETNGKHHSSHEAFAVLMEEVCELFGDTSEVEERLSDLWGAVRSDDIKLQMEQVKIIGSHAYDCILESIQVAAMSLKFVNYLHNLIEQEPDVTDVEIDDTSEDFEPISEIFGG